MSKKGKAEVIKKTIAKTPSVRINIPLLRLVLVLAVIVIYGQSVNFNFTLDDDVFYVKHASVQEGLSAFPDFFNRGSMNKFDGSTGLQPYRPASLLFFAIEKSLFNNAAPAAHFLNLLLYILIIQLLFLLLRRLFPAIHPLIIMTITLFFATHPIHTEVVASVKSLDELLAALFCFLAWLQFCPREGKPSINKGSMLLGSLFFFFALLSKESAIAFLIIIPLASFMLFKKNINSALLQLIPLGFMVGLFILMRYMAIGREPTSSVLSILDNVLVSATDLSQKTASIAKVLFYNIRLLFIPWPLSYDYSYNQIPIVGWGSPLSWLGFIIYAALFVFAVISFNTRRNLSFCVLFFFITSAPTTNIFFLNGAVVGERFLFIPSLGYCIAIILLLLYIFKIDAATFFGKNKGWFMGLMSAWILLFTGMSIARCADWKSNLSLFEDGVKKAPNSSRVYYNVASEYMKQSKMAETEEEQKEFLIKASNNFSKSLEIYPKNVQAWYNSSICYNMLGNKNLAISQYKKTIDIDAENYGAMSNLGVLYQERSLFDSALIYYQMAYNIKPDSKIHIKNMEDLYFFKGGYLNQRGENDGALACFYNSLLYNPKNIFSLNNIAILYSGKGVLDSARVYALRANAIDPGSVMVIENLARISFLSKNYNEAISYATAALKINSSLKKSIFVLIDSYSAIGNKEAVDRYRKLLTTIP